MNETASDYPLSPNYPAQAIQDYAHLVALARCDCHDAAEKIGAAVAKAEAAYSRVPDRWRAYLRSPAESLAPESKALGEVSSSRAGG